jgi:hypothetical protein
MRVSERCHYVLITTHPDETLMDAAGRMNCYQIGACRCMSTTGSSASSPSGT